MRRLTNSSTGRLGTGLADFLASQGHKVTLLLGQGATEHGRQMAQSILRFTTTADLESRLESLANPTVDAVFHAAAVNDFSFGAVWKRSPAGQLVTYKSAKLATRDGPFLVELVPAPKVILLLRSWFAKAFLVGWKFEVEGTRDQAIARAVEQLAVYRTNACVINGPAYGDGYGCVTSPEDCAHLPSAPGLYAHLNLMVGH